MKFFLNSQKLNCISVSHPVLNDIRKSPNHKGLSFICAFTFSVLGYRISTAKYRVLVCFYQVLVLIYILPLNKEVNFTLDLSSYFSFSYISSVTVSHHSDDVSSPCTSIARCENHSSGAAPCQCFTSAGILTQSPGFISTASFPSS